MIKDIISSAAGGRPLVLVSVVSSKGSTPRSAGAMMTVDESGLLAGTIGGGALEGRCLEEAVSFLKRLGSGGKKARPSGFLRSFSLNNSQAGDLGMICGGSTDVLFTPPVWKPERPAFFCCLWTAPLLHFKGSQETAPSPCENRVSALRTAAPVSPFP